MGTALKLCGNIRITDNRSRDELREHCNISGKVDDVLLRRHLAAIHVNRVAEYLECIEADTDRQCYFQKRYRKTCYGVEVCDEEVCVLAVSQKSETQHH